MAVFAEVAVKSNENGTHVEVVVAAESVKVPLVPPAEARMDIGGPPHLDV
jgi:hypothetical protein